MHRMQSWSVEIPERFNPSNPEHHQLLLKSNSNCLHCLSVQLALRSLATILEYNDVIRPVPSQRCYQLRALNDTSQTPLMHTMQLNHWNIIFVFFLHLNPWLNKLNLAVNSGQKTTTYQQWQTHKTINQSINLLSTVHNKTNKCKLRKKMHNDELPVKRYAYLCWPPIMRINYQYAD